MKIILLHILFLLGFQVMAKLPRDSVGYKTINGKTCIIHQVEAKETIYAISRKYNITVDSLMVYNKGVTKVKVGSKIFVPINTQTADAIKSKEKVDEAHANADAVSTEVITKHKVMKGDNLNKIAQKYNITTADLSKWNNLRDNKIEVGQILIVNGLGAFIPYKAWNLNNNTSPTNAAVASTLTGYDEIVENGFAMLNTNETNDVSKASPEGGLILVTNIENGKQTLLQMNKGKESTLLKEEVLIVLSAESAAALDIKGSEPVRIQLKYLSPKL